MKNMCLCQDGGANGKEEKRVCVRMVVQMQMKKMCLCENYGANANAETIFVSGRLCAELPSQTKALLLQCL